jgi:hypothetical protein
MTTCIHFTCHATIPEGQIVDKRPQNNGREKIVAEKREYLVKIGRKNAWKTFDNFLAELAEKQRNNLATVLSWTFFNHKKGQRFAKEHTGCRFTVQVSHNTEQLLIFPLAATNILGDYA